MTEAYKGQDGKKYVRIMFGCGIKWKVFNEKYEALSKNEQTDSPEKR
jgi:predicted transcriptional regulator